MEKTFSQKLKDKFFPRTEVMLYKQNKLSFTLCIIAILADCLMFLHIYGKSSCTPTLYLGIDLVINIVFLLLAFLFAENNKKYDKKCGYFSIALGVFEIIRIFTLPMDLHKKFLQNTLDKIVGLPTGDFIYVIILCIIAGVSLILSGLVCVYKTMKIEKYLKENK